MLESLGQSGGWRICARPNLCMAVQIILRRYVSSYVAVACTIDCTLATVENEPPLPGVVQTEDTDYEAAVEVSQALRSNMQRDARLSYKFEVCLCLLLIAVSQLGATPMKSWVHA
jgi:hypothetical protein